MRDTLEGYLGREVIVRLKRGHVKSPEIFFNVTGILKCNTQDLFTVSGDMTWVDFKTDDVEQVVFNKGGTIFIVMWS